MGAHVRECCRPLKNTYKTNTLGKCTSLSPLEVQLYVYHPWKWYNIYLKKSIKIQKIKIGKEGDSFIFYFLFSQLAQVEFPRAFLSGLLWFDPVCLFNAV